MGDLRQAAIDALIEWYGCKPNDLDAFKDIIERLPSTQPKPQIQTKDGAWYDENGFEIKQKKEVRLIDVDNAISVLRILSDKCGDDNVFEQAISVLKSVPEIDAAPVVHGEWMPIYEANEFGDVYQSGIYCSECGEQLVYEANFCPNCGTKMNGKE